MKNMKKVFVSFIVIVALFSMNSAAANNTMTTVESVYYAVNDIHTEYLKDNATFGTSDMRINITVDTLGRFAYIEEYFSADSENNPVPVMSRRYFDHNITNNTLSFIIQRPFGQRHYSMIRGVLLLNGKRVYEEWVKSETGDHLTYTDYKGFNIGANIEKFETKTLTIGNGITTYTFVTPDLGVYSIDARCIGSKNSALIRIELLKDVPDGVKIFPGTVYKYINVAVESRQIKDMNIRFKVENTWMADNNVAKSNIKLSSWNDRWYSLNTSIIGEDENYTYYNAEDNAENVTGITGFVIASLRYYTENNGDIVQTHKVVVVTSQTKVEQESPPKGIVARLIESFRRFIL